MSRQIVAALLAEVRQRAPGIQMREVAWAISQYTDAELLAYPELDRAAIAELRRWAATWRHVEPRL